MDSVTPRVDLTQFDSVLLSLCSSVGNRIWCKSGSTPRLQNFDNIKGRVRLDKRRLKLIHWQASPLEKIKKDIDKL